MVFGVALVAVAMVAVAVVGYSLTRRASASTVAQVHVDDLVLGRLPDVCAITGQHTTQFAQVESSRGGFQAWWLLLLFLGPVGIAAIAVLYVLGGRVERVTGVLPISPSALEAYNSAVLLARRTTVALSALVLVGAVAHLSLNVRSSQTALVLAISIGILVVALVVANVLGPARWVDLRLDGSGRWVTVDRSHPRFAAAVRQQYLAHQPGRG